MGISIAASAQTAGHTVFWSARGRSPASRKRARDYHLRPADTIAALCASCDAIISVCPPHAAEAVAQAVIAGGFRGYFCDANAIAPQKAQSLHKTMTAAGITFVDGSIVGPPAWQPGSTRLYLAGTAAREIAALFEGSLTETVLLDERIGSASALKMVFAAQTKGRSALIAATQAVAEELGLREELRREWALRDPDTFPQQEQGMRAVTSKAWRFAGEMREIAATFALAGMPPGFFESAGEVYERLARFKDSEQTPALDDVLAALRGDRSDSP